MLDEYPGTMAVGEVWVSDDDRLAHYLRADELQLAFNFKLLTGGVGRRRPARRRSTHSLAAVADTRRRPAGCCPTTTGHRHVTRYGGGAVGTAAGPGGALLQLALPGAVYLYNGDELGLPNVDLPDEALQDPDLGAVRAHRARPGRLPDPDAVVGHRAAVRLLDRGRTPGCPCPRAGPT